MTHDYHITLGVGCQDPLTGPDDFAKAATQIRKLTVLKLCHWPLKLRSLMLLDLQKIQPTSQAPRQTGGDNHRIPKTPVPEPHTLRRGPETLS